MNGAKVKCTENGNAYSFLFMVSTELMNDPAFDLSAYVEGQVGRVMEQGDRPKFHAGDTVSFVVKGFDHEAR